MIIFLKKIEIIQKNINITHGKRCLTRINKGSKILDYCRWLLMIEMAEE